MPAPKLLVGVAAVLTALTVTGAHASLSTLATFTGEGYGVSTSGCGSTTQRCTLNANVPAGATILKAYLYTSTFNSMAGAGGTFNGNAVTYTNLGVAAGFMEAGRADVTAFVAGGGAYTITETNAGQDGSALVVIYDDPTSTAVQTVAVLDGFSAPTGDSTTLNFSAPLNPAAPGFTAEMRLGIGFSFDGTPCGSQTQQTSTVTVNGTTITNSAGCNDDSVDPAATNGNLITVGSDNDAFSPFLPTIAQDHERYNLAGQINAGDTSISIRTLNPSNDDNIFLAVFLVTGEARVNQPIPEPTGLALTGLALAAAGWARRRSLKR